MKVQVETKGPRQPKAICTAGSADMTQGLDFFEMLLGVELGKFRILSREVVVTTLQSALADLCCTDFSALNVTERRSETTGVHSPSLSHA